MLLWVDTENYGRWLAMELGLYRKDILMWGFSFGELKLIVWATSSYILAIVIGFGSFLYYKIPFVRNKASLKLVKNEHFEKVIVTNIISNKENPKNISCVSLTLESGKVYVGTFEDIPLEHGRLSDFTITPILSGYRDNSDLSIKFNVNYLEHFKKDSRYQESPEEVFTDYKVTICREQVDSISLFDPNVYKVFQEKEVKPSFMWQYL